MDTLIPVYNLYSTFLHFLQCGCCFSDYLIVIFELLRTGITLIFKLRLSCVARAVSLGLRSVSYTHLTLPTILLV